MKFTDFLSEPSGDAVVRPATKSPNTAIAQGLLGVADRGLDLFQDYQGAVRERDIGDLMENTQNSILDMQDERNALLTKDQEIYRAFRDAQSPDSEGGYEITAEEQITLDAYQEDIEKIKRARQTGVLNPYQAQTRLNALQRKASAEARNLGVRDQIMQMFGKDVTKMLGPSSQYDGAFTDEMDLRYGAGNWTGVDAANEWAQAHEQAARVKRAEQFITNSHADVTDYQAVEYSGILKRLRTNLQRLGGAPSQEMLTDAMGEMNAKTSDIIMKIRSSAREQLQAGLPVDMKEVDYLVSQVEKQRDSLMKLFDPSKGEFGSSVLYANRLEQAIKLVDNVQKARLQQVSPLVANIIEKGDVSALTTLNTLLTNQSMFQGLFADVQEQNPDITQADLRSQVVKAMAILTSPMTEEDNPQTWGAINPTLAGKVGIQYLRRRITLGEEVKPEGVSGALDALSQTPSGFGGDKMRALGEPAVVGKVKPLLSSNPEINDKLSVQFQGASKQFMEVFDKLPEGKLSVDKDGRVVVEYNMNALAAGDSNRQIVPSIKRKAQALLDNIVDSQKKYGRQLHFNFTDWWAEETKEERFEAAGVDASTGGGEEGR